MVLIPAFHVSRKSKAKGTGKVFIGSRQNAASGTFTFKVFVQFDPSVNDYPTGQLELKVDLSDSLKGTFKSTSIELVNSHGKYNPTIYFTGRLKTSAKGAPKGLRFWFMIADNGGQSDSPKIAGFVIHDVTGSRVAYGTGPLVAGNVSVGPI